MTSPRHQSVAADDDVSQLPYPRRLGEAFCALLERLPGKLLPQHGGAATTVMVTIPFEQLRAGVGAADLGTEAGSPPARFDGSRARQDLIPVVLGGASEVLDLVARAGCSRRPSAERWPSATRGAARRGARSPQPGARPTTGSSGAGAGGRT